MIFFEDVKRKKKQNSAFCIKNEHKKGKKEEREIGKAEKIRENIKSGKQKYCTKTEKKEENK